MSNIVNIILALLVVITVVFYLYFKTKQSNKLLYS